MKTFILFALIFVFGLDCFAQSDAAIPETKSKSTDVQQTQAQTIKEIGQIKIHFRTDVAIVSPDSRKNLMKVADVFLRLPADSLVEIGSHTDDTESEGNDESNVKLSEARSEAVKNELVKLGVNATRITVKGYGSARPIADNTAAIGRAINRRTEFRIILTASSSTQSTPAPPTPEPITEPCPSITVSSPAFIDLESDTTFTAMISGGDPKVTPTFTWSISSGKIASGKGTSSISVSTANLKVGAYITATLDVGGYERHCGTSNSSTVQIKPK